ncbi:hypothetical protein EV401DRAFT_1890130 [Pisolithus croceorrhizus]|nr:hypothetical protein EV401DRAFT_1890130 [Pisolithus croceorrhizus]
MASSTRSTRHAASAHDALRQHSTDQDMLGSLQNIERLILAQAVYEYGADAWQTVSQVVSKHPCLTQPSSELFSPQFCQAIYTRLMGEAGLECSDANNVPHAPLHLKLAQRHYSARLSELRDLIVAEEAKFKRIVAEINEIRNGNWDEKIRSKLAGGVSPSEETSPLPPQNVQELRSLESLGNTDLEPLAQFTDSLPAGEEEGPSLEEPTGTLGSLEQQTSHMGADQISDEVVADALSERSVSQPPLIDTTEVEQTREEEELGMLAHPDVTSTRMEEVAVFNSHEISTLESREGSDTETPREGKRKASDAVSLDDNTREKKRFREESASIDLEEPIPDSQPLAGVTASVVSSSSRRRGTTGSEHGQAQIPPTLPNKRFQTVIGMLHSQISQHRNGNIFHNPIKSSEAPDYHEIIKRPMDLKTIKGRVKDGIVTNSLEFQRDVYLMFANAMMYNRPESDIYQMAEEMMLESEAHINTFRQTEGFVRSAHRP